MLRSFTIHHSLNKLSSAQLIQCLSDLAFAIPDNPLVFLVNLGNNGVP